jgi:hypothetical protein
MQPTSGKSRSARWSQTPLGALAAVAVLALTAFVCARHLGLTFGPLGRSFLGFGLLAAIGAVYDQSRRSRQLADGAYYCALWMALIVLAAILSYVAATTGRPLYDAELAKIDAAFGFAWRPWYQFVQAQRVLYWVFLVAYASGVCQILGSVIYFAWTRQSASNQELWWTALVAMLITVIASGIYPAMGTFHHFQENAALAVHVPYLLALRDGSVSDFPALHGIVTMPSYHTAQAILFMYVYRGQRRLFPWMVGLNSLMLLSTPTVGGHYLIDMIAGAAVAVVSIVTVRQGLMRQPAKQGSDVLAPAAFRPSRSSFK